jgi:hypothetical protein
MTSLATVPIDGNGNSGLSRVAYDFSTLLAVGDGLTTSAPSFVSAPVVDAAAPPLQFASPALVGNVWWVNLSVPLGTIGDKYATTCTATTVRGLVLVISVDAFVTELGSSDPTHASSGLASSLTSNYTATWADANLLGNTGGGGFAITLPPIQSGPAGFVYNVAKTDGSSNTLTLLPSGTDTVLNGASYGLSAPYGSISLCSDGVSNWFSIGGGITGDFGQIGAAPGPAPSAIDANLVQGRLTLTSGVPVTTGDVVGASTLYFTPFLGNYISLYDGSTWTPYKFTETSLALSGLVAGMPYDVYCFWNNGLVLGLDAWSGPNSRTGNLVLQDGVYVMAVNSTWFFLGTIYPTSATTTEDSSAKRFVSNYYNQRARRLLLNNTGTHTYNVSTWRPYNNDLTNRVEFVVAVEENAIPGGMFAQVNANGYVGINVDATDGSGVLVQAVGTAANTALWAGSAPTYFPSTPGYHFFQAMEYSGGGPVSNFTGMTLNAIIQG